MPEDTASSDILSVGFDTLLSVNGKLRGHPDDHAKLKCGIPEAESLDSVGMMTHFMLPENNHSFIDAELHMYLPQAVENFRIAADQSVSISPSSCT